MNFRSDDSVNTNNTLHKNVRVKIEPGTSSSVSSDSGVLKNIKMEPGLPTTTQRLTSYRLPRDLTLGGHVKTEKPKKIYLPNLNAQRNRKKDEPVTPKIEPTKSRDGGHRDRGRERGRGDRGRGRGNLIQSVGVWSEGINAPLISKKSGSSGDSSTGTRKYFDRPKINKEVDKIEKEKFKNLSLEDDSVDDNVDPDADADYIMLPMNKNYVGKLCEKEFKLKIDAHIDENNVDRKPIISESGEVINVKTESKVKIEKKEDQNVQLLDIIENNSNSYILMQFPPCLPGLKCNDDKEESRPKRPNDSRLTTSANDKEKPAFCTMSDLNSGLIGKLEILKSGKARIRLGDNYLLVHTGSHFSSLQHLLAAKLDTVSLTGELVNLGPVTDSLLCAVWYDHLLGKVRL